MAATPVRAWSPGRMGRLIRKELCEILRDRRTLLTLLLMPVLLYPLLGIAFAQLFRTDRLGTLAAPTYRIGYVSEAEGHAITKYLSLGEESLLRQGLLVEPAVGEADTPVASLPPGAMLRARLEHFQTEDPEADVRTGRLDLAVRVKGEGLPQTDPREEARADLEVLHREDGAVSREAYRYVRILSEEANRRFLAGRLRASGVRQRGEPVRLERVALRSPDARPASWLGALIPLILILMTITGAVYPAIDLTAGERERGTLEILVAAPIPRLSLLFAKYVAVLTVALLTALMNLGPMLVTLLVTGLAGQLFAAAGWVRLTVLLVEVLGLLMLFTAFFSAVLLALTSFARSFKEAQAYLIPLMLLALTPGLLALMPGLQLHGVICFVPLLNIVLLARDLLEGAAQTSTALTVIGATLLYAVLAIALAARVFGTEAVVASQPGRWTRWLRRRQPQGPPGGRSA